MNSRIETNFKKFDAKNKKTTDHFRRVKFEVVGDEDGPEELHAELPDGAPNLLQRRRLKRRQKRRHNVVTSVGVNVDLITDLAARHKDL